jgi:hypothetical protein
VNAYITDSNELAETAFDTATEGLEAPGADPLLYAKMISRLKEWIDEAP